MAQQPAAAPVLLALLPFLVYGRFLAGDELSNADVFLAYRPAHAWLAEGLRRGHVPLWNPDLLGGFPLAFTEYGWFSPLNWLPLALLGGHAGYYAAVALYVSLAGVATYLLARSWALSRPAALLAGLVFGQSLFVAGGTPLLNQGAAYWALPALLWCVEGHFRGQRAAAPLLGVVVALTLLGSHPQLAVIAFVPVLGAGLWRTVRSRRLGPAATLVLAGALGAGVAAVRLLPTLPMLAASDRGAGLTLAASAIGSVHPIALGAGLVFPSLSVPRYLNPQWSAYVGVLPLLLAWSATAAALRRRRNSPAAGAGEAGVADGDGPAAGVAPVAGQAGEAGAAGGTPPGEAAEAAEAAVRWHVRWLALLGAAGVVLALGANTPAYWLLQRTPVFAYFREPSRFLLWSVLAVALLAAFGLDRAARRASPAPGRTRGARLARWGPVLASAAVAVGFAAVSVVLRAVQAQALLRLQLNALSRAAPREFPADHYVAAAYRAWWQLLDSFNPLEPGLLFPLLAIAGAAWWWGFGRYGRLAPAAAVVCAAVPLVAYGQVRLPAIPSSVVQQRPALEALTARDAAAGGVAPGPRVLSWLPLAIDFETRVRLEGQRRNADAASYRLLKDMLAPNFGVAYGLAQLDGYENLMTREQSLLTGALGSERSPSADESALRSPSLSDRRRVLGERWDLVSGAGVGTVVSAERLQPLTWPVSVRYVPRVVPATPDGPALNLFEVTRPAPRVFLASDWVRVSTAGEALQVLLDGPGLDGGPPAVVVDEGGDSIGRPGATGGERLPAARREGTFTAEVIRYEDELVEIAIEADADALLVLLDANAPGWTATVTGERAPILAANVAFRAVQVPAGRHLVRFEYTPPHWRPALAATGVSALALGALALPALLAHRRARGRRQDGASSV